MELKEDNEETKIINESIKVPDIKYKTLKDAEKILKENNLKIQYDGEIASNDKENTIIIEQTPSAGINITSGSTIIVKIE